MDRDTNKSLRLMIVSGEASGDTHGAALVKALRDAAPETHFEFFGGAGPQMRKEGVDAIVETDALAILGLWEIARTLPRFWQALKKLKQAARDRKPDATILIDWPDFNLRLARWLHRRSMRVIYYVSPQLWAWRSYRVRNIRRDVDLLLSILPFEKQWYAERGVAHIEYVGHPLADEVRATYDRQEFCRRNDLDPSRPVISLLPGSRRQELSRILPPMLDAARIICNERSDVQFVVVIAPNRDLNEAEEIIAGTNAHSTFKKSVRLIHHQTREALFASDAAAIASGTATLEAALVGTPMVIVYKESFLNWHLLGSLITADHFGLVNLVAGRRMITELLQNHLNGEELAVELVRLLEPECNRSVRAELAEVTRTIGDGGASKHAATEILKFLSSAH